MDCLKTITVISCTILFACYVTVEGRALHKHEEDDILNRFESHEKVVIENEYNCKGVKGKTVEETRMLL